MLNVPANRINAFILSCSDVGFFLNPNRWFSIRVAPDSRPQQPIITEDQSNPLLWAIYAWGAKFTDDSGLDLYAQPCLKKALQLLATPPYLSINVPAVSVTHRIQAEVLVANFLFNEAQFVEARQHVAAAASLALTYGFHKIRASHIPDRSLMHSVPSSDSITSLPPSVDSVEEGERICAFWQVYVLDKTWSSVLGKPSFINETGSTQTYIDTPWPLAVEQYAQVRIYHSPLFCSLTHILGACPSRLWVRRTHSNTFPLQPTFVSGYIEITYVSSPSTGSRAARPRHHSLFLIRSRCVPTHFYLAPARKPLTQSHPQTQHSKAPASTRS
jgi:hypothetical protein